MITITYIGQCGFIFSNEEVSIAVDPVLNDLLDDSGETLRLYPPVMDYAELKVDYILCTHDHIDHMAKETLVNVAKLNSITKFVVPEGCKEELISFNISPERVIGVSDGKVIELNVNSKKSSLIIKGISAAHPVHQVDAEGLDHNLIYSIELDDKRLVHLGDTYLTDRIEKELLSLGKIDVLLPPINGRDDEREAKGIIGNLSCEEAAELSVKLGAELTIPTHFDMIKGNTANPLEFVECLAKLSKDSKYCIPVLNVQVNL